MAEDRMLNDEILLGLIKANSGGGGGGTTNYNDLSNKPQIGGNTLQGDKSLADLGIAAKSTVDGILDGQTIDSFGDVEKALAGKQDTLTFDNAPTENSNNPVKSGGVYSALADKATMLTGVTTPTQSEGEDGDVYLKLGFDSLSFKYIRFKVNAIKSGSLTQMARFKFWDSSDNALSYPTGTQVVSDPSSTGAEGVQNLITDSGKFLVTGLPTVTFTFPDDALLDLSTYIKYGWYTANDQPSRDPVSWELSASNDGTTWLSLDSVVNAEVPDTRSVLAFKGEYKQLGATKIENIYLKEGSWIKDQFAKQNEVESALALKANASDVTDALALKQDATDNSLDTEAKTIVGAINEHEGDISSLKSGLTNLDNEVNGDSTTYPYADVITIPDAIPANLAECNVKIEPVQDLHGYDKPWVGGANVNNLFPCPRTAQTITKGGYTATTDGNGYYTITGSSSEFVDIYFDLDKDYTTPDGSTHTLAIQNSVVNNQIGMALYYNDTFIEQGLFSEADRKIHYQGLSQVTYNQIGFRLKGDFSDPLTMKPYIYMGNPSDNVPFSSYENICPITGHTEVDVQRVGKNLCPIAKMNTLNSDAFELKAGTYILSFKMAGSGMYSTSSVILRDDSNADVLSVGVSTASSGTVKNGQFTLQSETTLHLYVNNISADASGYYIEDIQIELGSTATPYVPYAGKTYTILFKDAQGQTITVYGSDLDVKNGTLKVDRKYIEFDGGETESWTSDQDRPHSFCHTENLGIVDAWSSTDIKMISNQFIQNGEVAYYGSNYRIGYNATNGLFFVGIPSIDNVADFKTYLSNNHLQVVGILATPFTIQLTPQQIQLLKGTNTLTASTGQISVTVNGVSGSIGQVQEQVNELAEDVDDVTAELADKLPTAPTTDGTYVLTATVADGTPTYSWESAE